MTTIEEGFTLAKDTVSNVNEHIPVLAEYAEKCTSIAELGVDKMTTTWAFMKGLRFNKKKKKQIICVDIAGKPSSFDRMGDIGTKNRITMEFIESDSTLVTLPKSDLLYIDTAHHYALLTKELERHHGNISKYIIVHNTEIDGKYGELVRMCYYTDINQVCQAHNYDVNDVVKGLQPAIMEFLEKHQEWKVEKHLPNNNGLTILARTPPTLASQLLMS